MDHKFYPLQVSQVRPETDDAVTVFFTVPENLKETFQYKQGQYLTLRFQLNGKEERRPYSMCSSPLEDELAVTVKRTPDGLVSNHINDNLKAGDTVEVMPPDGRFYTPLQEDQKKSYYLFGAGSGITPLMSIIKTILEKEPMSTVHLLYGNRNEECIIFKEGLDALAQRYQDQFIVEYILSQPKRAKAGGLFGFLAKGATNWDGPVGRIERQQVVDFLERYPARNAATEYFICGPGTMIDTVEATLLNEGIDKKRIHTERFTTSSPKLNGTNHVPAKSKRQLIAHLHGEEIKTEVPENKTILDHLLDLRYDPPYSCHSGACSTCMAKMIKGSVKMDACYALDDDEIAEGYVLTCQSHPTSDEVELTYDF